MVLYNNVEAILCYKIKFGDRAMRDLTIRSARRVGDGAYSSYRHPARLGLVLCDGAVIGSLREREKVVLELDDRRHVVQCVEERPGNPGRTVSDVVRIPPGEADISLRLEWGEQTLFLFPV